MSTILHHLPAAGQYLGVQNQFAILTVALMKIPMHIHKWLEICLQHLSNTPKNVQIDFEIGGDTEQAIIHQSCNTKYTKNSVEYLNMILFMHYFDEVCTFIL